MMSQGCQYRQRRWEGIGRERSEIGRRIGEGIGEVKGRQRRRGKRRGKGLGVHARERERERERERVQTGIAQRKEVKSRKMWQ